MLESPNHPHIWRAEYGFVHTHGFPTLVQSEKGMVPESQGKTYAQQACYLRGSPRARMHRARGRTPALSMQKHSRQALYRLLHSCHQL